MKTMSEDAKAILLLCGYLGGDTGPEPLNQRDYNTVVRWLVNSQLRPADLLDPERIPQLARQTGLPDERLRVLLKRGVKLGVAVEEWNRSGIWLICRSDPEYPARLKNHLKDKAPPILFCTGKQTLLNAGGLAIVGSRKVDSDGEKFAMDVARLCAQQTMPVVSGGAKGVDQIAMAGALEAGGTVLGVLADSLLRKSVSRDFRRALAAGSLLLISPYHPKATFSVGNAMGRNKLIYAMADYGLVVSSDFAKGGTWEGATEELKRQPGRAVFVRSGNNVPKGNLELIKLGGRVFPSPEPTLNLHEAINQGLLKPCTPNVEPEIQKYETPDLFSSQTRQ